MISIQIALQYYGSAKQPTAPGNFRGVKFQGRKELLPEQEITGMSSPFFSLPLEQIRLRNGVSLEAIAEYTKISIRFLRAVETGEFEELPGGVFDTNFIRQYAEAIGYDSEPILNEYFSRQQSRAKEQVEAEAKIVEARGRWGCRWMNWFRYSSPTAKEGWGGWRGSNPRPPESQSGALPAELQPPQGIISSLAGRLR